MFQHSLAVSWSEHSHAWPVADGGIIVAKTAPAVGSNDYSSFQGGHEVTTQWLWKEPNRAMPLPSTSNNSSNLQGHCVWHNVFRRRALHRRPFRGPLLPWMRCRKPDTRVECIGPEAICCIACGSEVSPFRLSNGYTIVFDDERKVAIRWGVRWLRNWPKMRQNHGITQEISAEPSRSPLPVRHFWFGYTFASLYRQYRHHAVD